MKKAIRSTFFLVLIIILCGFSNSSSIESYNTDRIINTIKILSSRTFNGRMSGTIDGKNTEEYIEARFKEAGLKPGNTADQYFQEFSGVSGNQKGPYILEVLDKERVIKTYKYATDYKSLLNFSHDGDVNLKGVDVNTNLNSMQTTTNKIALIRNTNMVIYDFTKNLMKLYDDGYRGIIVPATNIGDRKKGQGGYDDKSKSYSIPRICVIPGVFEELLEYSKKGYNIHLRSAFEVKKYNARNVIGILKAQNNSDNYLIISAHMDHIGPDPDGIYFPGALDNASGIACVIELAGTLAKQIQKINTNIVFIAFSGEEEGLDGSRYYVSNPIYNLKNTKVLNLDMVGAKNAMPVSIVFSDGSRNSSKRFELLDKLEDTAKEMNLKYEVLPGSGSDHASFALVGVPAVTLIDYEKHIYHVPEDTIENIGIDNLKRDMNLTLAIIKKEAFKDGTSLINIQVYVVVSFLFIAMVLFFLYNKRLIDTKNK